MDGTAKQNDAHDQWVFFDVVGTLLMPEPDVATVYADIGARHGSKRSREEIDAEFQKVYADLTTDDRATDDGKEREFWYQVVSRLLPDVVDVDSCFNTLFDHFALSATWKPFEDVAPAFQKLREHGYQIALASNFDSRLRPIAEAMSPLDSVDAVIVSTEVGWKKPVRQFWNAAIEITGATPKKSVTVGDSYNEDIKTPRQLGLRGLWLQRSSQRRPVAVRTLSEAVERIIAARPPG